MLLAEYNEWIIDCCNKQTYNKGYECRVGNIIDMQVFFYSKIEYTYEHPMYT